MTERVTNGQLHRDLGKLEAKVANHDERLEKMGGKVDEMHQILVKAKGAKWLVLFLIGTAYAIGKLSSYFILK
jgi:hypothetical protein